jgi:hypothetical protein
MKRTGPLLTLLAGLGVGAALFAANNAVSPDPPAAAPAAEVETSTAAAGSPGAAAAPSAAPPSAAAAPKKATATWAGEIFGGGATIAIAAEDGVAIAYLCDGDRIEAWLQGTAVDGKLALTGDKGELNGTFANGRAKGTVVISGDTATFDVGTVKKPSGLYRATANVRNAEVVNGWIVIGRRQIGGMNIDGASLPGPVLDLDSGTAVVDGVTVTAVAVP